MRTTPAEAYFVHDELTAFCFNRAVMTLGSMIESELQDATKDAKNDTQRTMRQNAVFGRWFGADSGVQKFRDPVAKR